MCTGDLPGVPFAIVAYNGQLEKCLFGNPNLWIADYPPTDLGLCLIATYRQLCTLLFVQNIPVTQQAEAQCTSQKVGSGACDDRRNNLPDYCGRHDGLQRDGSFEYIFEQSGS